MSPGHQIKKQAPAGAYLYRLVHRTSNGTHRTFPQNPATFFFLAHSPPSLASGTYDIVYYDIDLKLLDSAGKKAVFSYEDSASTQLRMSLDSAASELAVPIEKAAHAARSEETDDESEDDEEEEDELDAQDADDETAKPLGLQRAHVRDRLAAREEARHLKMLEFQLKADKQTQKILRESQHTREVGETHQLNALLRREVVEANRIAALANKRGFDELGRYREANQALREDHERNIDAIHRSVEKSMALMEIMTEKVAAQLVAPPPQATDFTGLGKAALEMVEKIGVALLMRGMQAPALPAQPPTAPVLAAPPQTAPVVKPAPTVQQPPPAVNRVLAKLAAKFSSRGELDLARQMSTPEGLKTLFDEIGAELESEDAVPRPPGGDSQKMQADGDKPH